MVRYRPPHGQIIRRIFDLGKGCLATLARAVNQYDWRVFQRLRQSALNIARNERFKHRLIVTFRFVQSKCYGSSDRNVSRWRPVKFFIDVLAFWAAKLGCFRSYLSRDHQRNG